METNAETAAPQANPTPPPGGESRKRGRRLGNATDVRAALAFVWREVEAGRMSEGKARVLAYVGATLLNAIAGPGVVDERLRALEQGMRAQEQR